MARDSRSSNPHRLWLVALVPATVVALALTTWHARQRAADIEAQALDHASALTRQFAALVAPDLERPDRARLQATARAVAAHYPTIRSVQITDRQGRALARGDSVRQSPAASADFRSIERPVTAGPGVRPLGQFSVRVDLSALRIRQAALWWQNAGLAGLLVLGASATIVLLCTGRSILPRLLSWQAARWRPLRALAATAGSQDLSVTMAQLRDDNERLEAARREAEAASKRKSRYLADIGHEIRTPMNAILGFTELMARNDRRARNSDHVATIRDSVRALLGLLNGMLDVSKAEAGQLELDDRHVDVNALLEEMFRLFAPQAFVKGVEVVVSPPPPESARVRADPVRLKQVLVNLLSNAIRFTQAGHIRLSVDLAGQTQSHVRLRFAIEDTGCGIAEADQPHLFEAFLQGERVGDPQAPALEAGAGLGLSIATELAGLMGGHIEFRSREGVGSTFWFDLDLERGTEPVAALGAPGVRRRVALIDHEDATREPHLELMARAGIDAESMNEGEWAAVTAPDCYDAIVVHIPARDAANDRIAPPDPRLQTAGIPLVALVYEHDTRLQDSLWHAGYRRVVGKTADPGALLEALEVALMAQTAAPADDGAQAPGGTRRVLVVDDQPVNLRLMRQSLADLGLSAETAATSDEALHRAAHDPFDAILLDLRLPDRDGYETARRLREIAGANASRPVIAVTADCPAAEAEHALAAGFDDVLGKPVTQEALWDRLRAWIADLTPDPQEHDGPVVDRDEALARARNKPDLADELFAALLRTLPASRRALTRARLRGDCDGLRSEAHRLRGAVVYCGVPRLEAAIGELDRALHGREEMSLTRAVHRLERAIVAVQAYGGVPAASGAPQCATPGEADVYPSS